MQPSQNYINILSKLENIGGKVGDDEYTWYYDNIGVATLAYGHALVDTNGNHIRRGEVDANVRANAATTAITGHSPISIAEAQALKLKDLTSFSSHVNPLLRSDTTQCQYDALLDFAYNVGAGALASSTLLRMHNNSTATALEDVDQLLHDSQAKKLSTIGQAFCAWSNEDHQWSLGVFHRRAFEFLIYTGMDYDQAYTTAWAVRE